jgi:hypothetical protein
MWLTPSLKFLLFSVANVCATLSTCAQTTITLETGTTAVAWQLREVGDSLATEHGRYAKRDILHLAKGKETYVFNVKSMGLTLVKFKETCGACRLGRIYGAKYAGALLMAADFRPRPNATLLADPLFDRFQQEEQNDREQRIPEVHVRADALSDEQPKKTTSGNLSSSNMVITRAGDTLRVGKDFFAKGDTLCWFGGGRLHRDEVLLIIDRHGQSVFSGTERRIVELDVPVIDRSTCSMAIILANIYPGASVSSEAMKGIDQRLITIGEFKECHAAEQQRLADIATRKANRNKALGTIGRVGRVITTVTP